MASKAGDKVVKAVAKVRNTVSLTERMLWEKYNAPSRNLFQALASFENNGVGQRVVCNPSLNKFIHFNFDESSNLSYGRKRDSRIVFSQ